MFQTYAIAFVPRNRDVQWPNTKAVALGETEAGPFSSGSFEDVLGRIYPLSRVIYAYVNIYPGKPIDPLAKEFLRVALSQEGQQAAARSIYLPLTADAVSGSLKMIQ